MEQIGTKHKLIFSLGSKLIILAWFIYALLSSLIINSHLNLEHLINSLIFYALFFLPIYFLLISLVLKKEYKKRIKISLLALIPVIVSYIFLLLKMNFLIIEPIKAIYLMTTIFLFNLILSLDKKLLGLKISTVINVLFGNIVYYIYMIKYVTWPEYQVISLYSTNKHLLDTYIIILILINIILISVYYIVILIKLRKEELNARNSRS